MYSTNAASVRLQTQADLGHQTTNSANDNKPSSRGRDDAIQVLGFDPTPTEVAALIAQATGASLIVDRARIEASMMAVDSSAASAAEAYAVLIAEMKGPAASRILASLDGLYDPGDVLELRCLSVSGGKSISFNGRLGDAEERGRMLACIEEQLGWRNLYIGINPRAPSLAGNARACSELDVLCRRHVVLDLDDHSAPAVDPDRSRTMKALDTMGPALVARSGNGWHYWFDIELLNGEQLPGSVGPLGQAMTAIHGDNIADLARIIRLPYSINIPDPRKRRRGNVLSLAEPRPTVSTGARMWTVEDLIASLTATAISLGIEPTGRLCHGRPQHRRAGTVVTGTPNLRSAPSKADLLELLSLLPNGDTYPRTWQSDVAHAVRGSVKHTPFDDVVVREAFLAFSSRYPGDPHEDAKLYDSIKKPWTSWRHLLDMLALTNPDDADRLSAKGAAAVFASIPIDPAQAALLAAMPPVDQPGVPEWAARLNKRFAYIMALDRVIEIDPATGVIVDRHTLQAFRTFHDGSEQLRHGAGDKAVGLGSAWLKSPFARRYERTGMWPVGQEPAGVYNVWGGLPDRTSWPVVALTAALADPLSVVLEFITGTIASRRKDVADYVLNWLAYKLQNPLDPTGTTLAFIGRQGTGKTTLAEMLIDMVGPRSAVTASNERQMVGNFNAHFEDKLVAVFEEAFLGRDPRMAGPFKDLVTGARLHIEAKGRDVRDVPNRLAIVLTSNDASVVPLEPNDRRTTLIRVSDAHRTDNAYFEALRAAWTNGGREAFIEFLLARNLTAFDPRRPLKTPEKAQALAETGDPVVRFWGQLIAEGEPVASWQGTQDWAGRGVFMSNADVYGAYQDFARRNGIKYLASSTEFNRRIDELCPGRRETRRRVKGPNVNGPRGHDYPALDLCRAAFDDAASSGSA